MKAVSLITFAVLFVANFSDAAVLPNLSASKVLETIENKPVDLLTQAKGQNLPGGVQNKVGDQFKLSGLTNTNGLGDVEKIVLNQPTDKVSVVLEKVKENVFKVKEVVPSQDEILKPKVDTLLSLVNSQGKAVPIDVSQLDKLSLEKANDVAKQPTNVVQNLLGAVTNAGGAPVTLVLSLVKGAVNV